MSGAADRVTIANGSLTAIIAARGAELVSLIADGDELLWSGDPDIWGWHAPNLFPIVGKLADDTLLHDGRRYPMKQHGFLRHSQCRLVGAEAASCAYLLRETAETLAQYPFRFELTLAYVVAGNRLACSVTLRNPGDTPLPASFGLHPAFRWPLPGGTREESVIRFAEAEPAPVRRLAGGLLDPAPRRSPVEGCELRLNDSLFEADAIIFDEPRSRSIAYGVPGSRAVALDFADFPYLGIWSKPGAGFVCLEPWQGFASPSGFAGEFAEKPGVVSVAPGGSRTWRYGIAVLPGLPDPAS